MVTQYFFYFFFSTCRIDIFLGFCDAINIKGVKWVFRYFGNVKGTPNIKKNNVLKLCLKISSITYISGPNGVLKKINIKNTFLEHIFSVQKSS